MGAGGGSPAGGPSGAAWGSRAWRGMAGEQHGYRPPTWVPVPPPRPIRAATAGTATWRRESIRRRRLGLGALLSVIVALAAGVVVSGPTGLERLVGLRGTAGGAADAAASLTLTPTAPLPPALTPVSQDAAGSSIVSASYPATSFGGATGSFLVYLPPGY